MTQKTQTLTFIRPDDWHLHLRDGAMLRTVLPYTIRQFGRAVIMPNLIPPITTEAQAIAYRNQIMAAVPIGMKFTPLMTSYLTDESDPDVIQAGYHDGVFAAVKLYPANATTNSDYGVSSLDNIRSVLARLEKIDMPLLVHGEEADPEIDIFDREAMFIDRVLSGLVRDYPALRIVLEHITTAEGVAFVKEHGANIAATITPHHLIINRNALLAGGIRPHMYCLPVAKRERHRLALRQVAASGEASFFLGTDSAPHTISAKETNCGCAGIFNAPNAIELYAQVFDEENALDQLEKFASLNGPAFYGLPPNDTTITLTQKPFNVSADITVEGLDETLQPFLSGETLAWTLIET
ncbi:dihydroorotase [Alphaproteobacteria bacterium]|nr:dihydroorotase [Alphaproteobacteria bacterium]